MVTCPAVVVASTLEPEEYLVVSLHEVCPLPPTQSVCAQGEEAA